MRQFQYKKFDTVFFHESFGPKSFGLNYFCVEFESFKTISSIQRAVQKNQIEQHNQTFGRMKKPQSIHFEP